MRMSAQDSLVSQRRRWLAQIVATGGRPGRFAVALLLADAIAAVAFAAGFACALTRIGHELGAAAAFLALGAAAAAARGLLAAGALQHGTSASAMARSSLRGRMTRLCLHAAPGAKPVGEWLASVVDEVEALDGYITRFAPAQRACGPAMLVILAAVAVASPICAAILIATVVPFVLLMILAGGAAADQSRRQFDAFARLSGGFADAVRALPLVLSYQAEARVTQRLAGTADDLRRRTMSVLKIAFVSSAGVEFFAALSVALVAVYAGFNLLRILPVASPERLDLGRAVFALALAPEFYLPMRRLAAAYHDRQAAETAADRLMAIEASRPAQAETPVTFTTPPAIRFAEATVNYPGDDKPALVLEAEAPAGAITVLLGPSGCGKTTALKLLLGLAPLSGGEVWIDDAPLSGIGSVAASAAWMGQAPLITAGTLADNIALSRPGASESDIVRAAEAAGCDSLIASRPGGLATVLDERGGCLSGGERRRVALARALLKPAPILLLDEPTAHLDAASEAALIETIRSAARGRTTVIATHSAALAAIADHLVQLGEA